MKCGNCGYKNSEGKTHCIKCHSPLPSANGQGHGAGQASADTPGSGEPKAIAKTLMGQQPKEPFVDRPGAIPVTPDPVVGANKSTQCVHCGYPVMSTSTFCPNCNEPIKSPEMPHQVQRPPARKPAIEGTIDPFRKTGFSLRPIVNGVPSSTVIEYSENQVKLNRGNTLQENMTITSKVQAEIIHKDGVWTIQDHSDAKTTFVQAAEPKEIRKGDIIVMGDTKFIFE